MTDEMYVRSVWKRVEVSTFTGFSIALRPGNWPVDLQGFEKELVAWKYAAEFTRQREEEIRQREKDRGVLNSIILRTPTGEELESLTNIDMREHSALAELKRGMKEDMQ
jgi:hypothetical protein